MKSHSLVDQLKDFFSDEEYTTPLSEQEFAEKNRFYNSDHRLGDLDIVIAEEINSDLLKKI